MTMPRVLLAAIWFLSGCGLSQAQLRHISASGTGCPAQLIEITEDVSAGNRTTGTWTARGCEREWHCGLSAMPTCTETAASEARTILTVATDRLQLETNCPADRIRLVRQADWKRGTETAYRFEACGKHYVCTAAAGRTDCKPALQE